MLQDEDFAADLLDMCKHQSVGYTKSGIESSHPQVRQLFLDIAQQSLQEQWEMYQLAEQKGWYLPAGPAQRQDVQKIQQHFEPEVQKIKSPQPTTV